MDSKHSMLSPTYGIAMELFYHWDHQQRWHFSILGIKTEFELKDGGIRFKITRCLKQNYKWNYWGILYGLILHRKTRIFPSLKEVLNLNKAPQLEWVRSNLCWQAAQRDWCCLLQGEWHGGSPKAGSCSSTYSHRYAEKRLHSSKQ